MQRHRRLMFVTAIAGLSLNLFVTRAQPTNAAPPVAFTVKTDRENALYRCGETVEFVVAREGEFISNAADTGLVVKLRFTLDGGKLLDEQNATVRDSMRVRKTLDEPGFLRCNVSWPRPGEKPGAACAAAGFEPDRIRAETTMPDDFDVFWSNAMARLAAMPLDPRAEEIPSFSDATSRCQKISVRTIDGTRIYAFLGLPANRPPPFPLIVLLPGAGLGPPSAQWVKDWAGKGAMALNIGIHAFDIGLPRGEIEDTYAHFKIPGTYAGVTNREAYLFYRSILGLDRMIKAAMDRPDFDGTHAVVTGSSQGGGLALMMAGLNPRITACAANVPALCDHGAYRVGRSPGWPLFVPVDDPQRDSFMACSRYYDTVNFARNITCPAIVSVGFVDGTCSPGSVYGAYNEIKASKRLFTGPSEGHAAIRSFTAFTDTWLVEQLGLSSEKRPDK